MSTNSRALYLLAAISGTCMQAQTQPTAVAAKYCVTCHSNQLKTGGLSLQALTDTSIAANAETWEKAIRKVRAGSMPPQGAPRPDKATLDSFATFLETSIDKVAATKANPGRSPLHRLNRAEYGNAIRDILGLEIDASSLLPPDDESNGFDNIADVLRVSPSLMERYLSASWNISRLAVGNPSVTPTTFTHRVKPDLSQDQHIEGLPLGSRGGTLVKYNFPTDGEYIIRVRLWRNTFDLVRGMEDPHEVEIALDGKRIQSATVGSREDFVSMAENPGAFGTTLDKKLTVRVPVTAGPHTVTAAVMLRSHAIKDDVIKPFMRTTIDGLDITGDPSVDRVYIEGPFQPKAAAASTPSRERIFICHPTAANDEVQCARKILSNLVRKAYRRPAQDRDLEQPLSFYQRARNSKGNFEAGIEAAVQFVLSSPEFLFRVEDDPANVAPGAAYRVSDMALASRLSFFLWSTVPDDTLVNLASQGKLKDPATLDAQVKRMLADPRAAALSDNFAEQWLFLRNLKSSSPNMEAFPDFDDNLRQAMGQETKLFFNSIVQEDRGLMDLLNADYTFVNERLARHYGIPGIYGSQFRRIKVDNEARRGLLGQAAILTVTSYPNRTSPVQRGKWILGNILGIPPLPPPPDVPPLGENAEGSRPLTLRERMEAHRANAVCAGCHKIMDPIGFALENFDAIGRWRTADSGAVIDPSGSLYDGSKVSGAVELRKMIAAKPDVFAGVVTERLLTYALGRGLEFTDMPTVRKIVHDSSAKNLKFSSVVMGIVQSPQFQMKVKPVAN